MQGKSMIIGLSGMVLCFILLGCNLVGMEGTGIMDDQEYTISELNGSGTVHLLGESDSHEVILDGSGTIRTEEFATNKTTIQLDGSGSAYVNARLLLQVQLDGSGNIYYKGVPHIETNITGTGDLIQY
jgi:hypothetical protein